METTQVVYKTGRSETRKNKLASNAVQAVISPTVFATQPTAQKGEVAKSSKNQPD